MARPTEYTQEILIKTKEYLDSCIDVTENFGTPERPHFKTKVKIPTIEGLAVHLGISRETVYAWEKEENKQEFSDIIGVLRSKQAERLVNNGLSGDYNPTIAKVLLTKHGYREGLDQTTNDKDIPVPILNALRNNDSDKTSS